MAEENELANVVEMRPAPEPAPEPAVDEPLPRETGSEKSEKACETCGGPLPVVRSAYGSLRTGACPNCSDDQLEAQKAAAEGEGEGGRRRRGRG